MEIKIGLKHSPREVNAEVDMSVEQLKELLTGTQDLVEIADSKGTRYLIKPQEVSYVEVRTAGANRVGFSV